VRYGVEVESRENRAAMGESNLINGLGFLNERSALTNASASSGFGAAALSPQRYVSVRDRIIPVAVASFTAIYAS